MNGASAFVRNIFNSGTTRFENVKVHGIIQDQYNVGSFYNYGTANYGGSDGCDYEVIFQDCISDAKIICTTANNVGGMVGHVYEGNGHKATIRFNNSEYIGKAYLVGGKVHKYISMASGYNNDYYVDGELFHSYNDDMNVNGYNNMEKLTIQTPEKTNDGYYVDLLETTKYVIVYINAQLTAYDGDTQIQNLSGITITLVKTTHTDVTPSTQLKVLDTFTNFELVNNAESYGAVIENGKLTVTSAASETYKTGTVRINVEQYDYNNEIVASGQLNIVSKNKLTDNWSF